MTFKLKFKTVDDRVAWDRIIFNLGTAEDKGVVTGIFKGDISEYAHHNEYGAPRANIPKRPFMRTSFDQNQDSYLEMFESMWAEVVGPAPMSVKKWLTLVGLKARNDIIKTISQGGFASNAPSTVQAKRSSKPLVDTGDMQRAITFFVGAAKRILQR